VFGASDMAKGPLADTDIRDSLHGIRSVYIPTPRGWFAAVTAGPRTSSRQTVLLVHGFAASKEDWIPALERIAAAGYRPVAYDLGGHYQTALMQGPGMNDDVRLDRHAADLLAITEALDGGPVHVVAHSFGGEIAVAAVLADAQRFATLTLCGSGQGALRTPQAEQLRLLRWALGHWPQATVWKVFGAPRARRPRFRHQPPVNAERENFLRDRFLAHDASVLQGAIDELLTPQDRSEEIRRCGTPTLVMYGAQERYWRKDDLGDMAKRMQAQLAVIQQAAHSPHRQNLNDTVAALLPFWATADAARQPTPTTDAGPALSWQHQSADMTALVDSPEQASAA